MFLVTCNLGWIGDWFCDDENNNIECDFDGGDCCGPYVDTTYCEQCVCLNATKYATISMFFHFLNFLADMYSDVAVSKLLMHMDDTILSTVA